MTIQEDFCISSLHSTMLLLYLVIITSSCSRFFLYIPLCFYYINQGNAVHQSVNKPLHSTMLLLYHCCHVYVTNHVPLYIPLCFYYISTAWRLKMLLDYSLHSTMLLLYPQTESSNPKDYILYIPLCFYYISSCRNVYKGRNTLYIPLCFYYIVMWTWLIKSNGSTLHSTMLLLYHYCLKTADRHS